MMHVLKSDTIDALETTLGVWGYRLSWQKGAQVPYQIRILIGGYIE